MKINVLRAHYNKTTTTGIMLIDDQYFGYTLEDVVRHTPKEYGKTAIPAGLYRLDLTYSNRFKRLMPEIYDVPFFTGIRIHGGNTHVNTLGCLLVARNRLNDNTIQGTLERELIGKLKSRDGEHWIEIFNTTQIG